MQLNNKVTALFVLITICLNTLVILYLFSQHSEYRKIESVWSESYSVEFNGAIELAKLEGELGYIGFIHNFKNYVLRNDDTYYQKAIYNYKQISASLSSLEKMLPDSYQVNINDIRVVVEEYHSKLLLAKQLVTTQISIDQLDLKVKVDDNKAERALHALRNQLIPDSKIKQQEASSRLSNLQEKTTLMSCLVIVFFILGNLYIFKLFRRIESSKQQLSTIFEISPNAIIYADEDGKIVKANQTSADLFEYTPSELSKLNIENLVPQEFRKKHKNYRVNFMKSEQSRAMEERGLPIRGRKKNGELVDIDVSISSKLVQGKMRTVCIIRDLTTQRQLQNAAHHDHLTQLKNRRAFDETLAKELERAHREQQSLSFLMIDLDFFKQLNDNEGHSTGDNALRYVAEFLRGHSRTYDHIFRWGGDEFVLLCPNLDVADSINHAERLRKTFELLDQPWTQKLTLSIGISTSNAEFKLGTSAIIETADKAVYLSKTNGKNMVTHSSY